MRLVRFGPPGAETPGVLAGDVCFDVSSIIPDLGPSTIHRVPEVVRAIEEGVDFPTVDLTADRLGSPIARPHKIVAVGLNYADHAVEAGLETPAEPILFTKATSSMSGPHDDVILPPGATKVDWEVELGVVIGATGRHLTDEDAAAAIICGYVMANDVSERAHQLERGGQWVKGKSADTFCPVGPWLVTADQVADPLDLEMRLSVNGVTRQHGSTSTMIFSPTFCVAYISRFMTLEPGDLVLTGTPPGVGLATGEYLSEGDVMELEIEGLGVQSQRCVAGEAK